MTNKLISLVIIIFILSIGHSYSDTQFIFPKEKPSIFKKINKNQGESFSSNLPQKKPIINRHGKYFTCIEHHLCSDTCATCFDAKI